MFIDLHIHSTASDGTDSPEEIVEKIGRHSGVKIFALTDHDTIAGIEKLPATFPDKAFFINGVEFSCKIADGAKCHILAYFFDTANGAFQQLLSKGNELRKVQLDLRLKYLSKKYNITFSESDIAEMCKSTVVGKPHIVNFVSDKFGLDKESLYKDLRKCYVGDARQDAATVINAIKESGGISVWAHPLGGESVKELVEGINRKYYLPSIQREFVWDTDRIARLFDSLMKGFPIGSFLFWEVPKDKIEDFRFYEFIRDFHALKNKHNKVASLTTSKLFTAILDGQQRMTSLYIGLKGTYAEKLKHKRKENENAYPVKNLYLNLMNKFDAETADERGLTYDFKFLESSEAKEANESGEKYWFQVKKIVEKEFAEEKGVYYYLKENKLLEYDNAADILFLLREKICAAKTISFYLEKSEELDTVVNIFIRVNSGGVVLSYSDLLLSFATAQLHGVQDFRGDIYNFVDDINDIGGSDNFAFDKDFVLKAILVLCDLDIKFRTKNFNNKNMPAIHDRWDKVTEAIHRAVSLISSYGFNKTNIVSANALIPIAYYILQKNTDPKNYTKEERDIIRHWFVVASIGGLFRSSTDNVLKELRGKIKANNVSFPAQECPFPRQFNKCHSQHGVQR